MIKGWKARENAAEERRKMKLSTPEIRAARAAHLEREAAIQRGEIPAGIVEPKAPEPVEPDFAEADAVVTDPVDADAEEAVEEAAPAPKKGGRPKKS
jgi:hypothetical protein